MAVDLKQFHQVFIEECVEGLDAMESALMELDVTSIDDEVINTIFRSAHSIKGGAGTFGFSALASFTHVLETLLDEVRSGTRGLELEHVNLLLQSVDCMRELLELIQEESNEYTAKAIEIQAALEKVLDSSHSDEHSAAPSQNNSKNTEVGFKSENGWHVCFRPNTDLIRTGNDPLRIIRELEAMASKIEVVLEGEIPSLSDYTSEDSYFSWNIALQGDELDKSSIMTAFEWVVDDCELLITSSNEDKLSDNIHDSIWAIHFLPYPQLFQTGNDPLRIINELHNTSDLISCEVDDTKLPSLKLFDSERCYLSWNIQIKGDVDKSLIDEAFEWVIDEADINIEKLSTNNSSSIKENLTVDANVINKNDGAIDELEKNPLDGLIPSSSVQNSPHNTSDKCSNNTVPIIGSKETKKALSQPKASAKKTTTEASSIRVGIDKVDSLINMVGELVITQSMLGQLGGDFDIKDLPKLIEGLNQLEQNTRELQESVMRIRMLPISFAFSRFPRMVRDLGQNLNKKINLILLGENTELDKTVMEKIGDPLVHLVRNSVDHGIETADERLASGKSEAGTVTLNAYHQGGNVIIEIIDDGKGLDRAKIAEKGVARGLINESEAAGHTDEQIFDLIFQPGFSTAESVSSLSGRGVGMDVVKRNIQALNGVVEIQSKKGEGTKIKISLPLTLAILDGQLVRVKSEIYIFPLVSIVESMQYREELVNHIAGGCSVFKLRDEYVPIVDLAEAFGRQRIEDYSTALMVVVECDGFKVAMVVNELMAQQQVVIKSLEQNYKRIEGVSGATILGDGTVALIIDVPGVVRLAGADQLHQQHALRRSA